MNNRGKRVSMEFYIGCSGWKSQEWAKTFYPTGLDSMYYLSYYSNHFNFVHLNLKNSVNTLNSSTLRKWLDETPDDFRFSIQLPQNIIDVSSSSYSLSPSPSFSRGHYDLLGEFLENLHVIEEKVFVVLLSPPSYISLQDNGRKWLEDTLTKCTYHGYSVAMNFGKRSTWYQELTYNILRKYKSSFVWSNNGHQYYYPAITSNFIFLNLGDSYINRQTATRYLNLIKQKANESKHQSNNSNDALDYSVIVTKNPSVARLIQKLVSIEENPSRSLTEASQQQQQQSVVSPIWPGRVIMHIDMNAFFPACEELRDYSLKDKAHAVIMTPEKEGDKITRGAVASCSYEARKYGVRSAMSLSRAKELCPDLILRPVDKEYYSSVSQQVMRLIEEYADVLEQTSIDEAYIDCTKKIMLLQNKKYLHERSDQSKDFSDKKNDGGKRMYSSTSSSSQVVTPGTKFETSVKPLVEEYALKIKSSIREQCNGLICSIGVASNKSIAKIASDFEKPDGLTIVYPQNTKTFLSKLTVDHISGIGIKTTKTLKHMGINTIGDLSNTDIQKLLEKFGKKQGLWMWQIANGKDDEPVVRRGDNLSLSTEETLLEPINDRDEILKILLYNLTNDIYNRLERKGYQFKTVGIKMVRTNFSIETREITFPSYQRSKDSISSVMEMLLDRFNFENDYNHKSNHLASETNNKNHMIVKKVYSSYIRKLGIKVSNLSRIDVTSQKSQKSILDFV